MYVFMADIYDVVFAISQPLPLAFGSLRSIVVRIIARHAIDGGSIPPGDIFCFSSRCATDLDVKGEKVSRSAEEAKGR